MKLLPAIATHKKFWIALISFALLVWTSFQVILVGDTVVMVERASTDTARARGLSNRPSIGERAGMWFVFREKENPVFWMKDMQFPIDIVWIADGRVVALDENVKVPPQQENDDLHRYQSAVPVDRVLEINAGNAKKWGISVGSRVYGW